MQTKYGRVYTVAAPFYVSENQPFPCDWLPDMARLFQVSSLEEIINKIQMTPIGPHMILNVRRDSLRDFVILYDTCIHLIVQHAYFVATKLLFILLVTLILRIDEHGALRAWKLETTTRSQRLFQNNVKTMIRNIENVHIQDVAKRELIKYFMTRHVCKDESWQGMWNDYTRNILRDV